MVGWGRSKWSGAGSQSSLRVSRVTVQGASLAVVLEPKMSEETISVGVGKCSDLRACAG